MTALPKVIRPSILELINELKEACDALEADLKWEKDPKYAKALECATFEGRHMGGYDPSKWPISRTEADALIQADPDYPETPWPHPAF